MQMPKRIHDAGKMGQGFIMKQPLFKVSIASFLSKFFFVRLQPAG
jgi:hypothetical protein